MLILVIIRQGLAGLWPFFDLIFVVRFRSITFEGMHWFHSDVAEIYITVKYRSNSILVIIHQILAELWPFFNLVFVGDIGFRSITFAEMHWFYWKFAEGYIIVKYRSGLILVIIRKNLAKLWPFFSLVFVVGVKNKVKILFPLNNFWRDALISYQVCRMVYHYSIEVKFDFGNHPKNFGRIIALY